MVIDEKTKRRKQWSLFLVSDEFDAINMEREDVSSYLENTHNVIVENLPFSSGKFEGFLRLKLTRVELFMKSIGCIVQVWDNYLYDVSMKNLKHSVPAGVTKNNIDECSVRLQESRRQGEQNRLPKFTEIW